MFYGQQVREIFQHWVDILITLLAFVITCSVSLVVKHSFVTVSGTRYPDRAAHEVDLFKMIDKYFW